MGFIWGTTTILDALGLSAGVSEEGLVLNGLNALRTERTLVRHSP